jgi:hypothetical protein
MSLIPSAPFLRSWFPNYFLFSENPELIGNPIAFLITKKSRMMEHTTRL